MSFDVEHILGQLTVAEKASLTSGSSFFFTWPVERLGIPKIMVADGPHGLRPQPGDADHLGKRYSVPSTCFPTACAIASSWNPALVEEVGAALAQEARANHLSVILGPGVNMKRSPLCGRNFEYYSEDPFLTGELAVGFINGVQQHGDVGTSLKHYVANNQETERLRVDARVSERALREIYLPAFERAVTGAQPWTVMCSYNKVNGHSLSQNERLLEQVLRQEFGFQGLVVSDWGAVYDRLEALRAGTDLEMPPTLPYSPDAISAAVESGELDESVLDTRVRAVLTLVSKGMGVLDTDATYDEDRHHALARAAAAESLVLLKNDDGLLPLGADAKIAVVGEFARTPRFQGAGSSLVNPTRVDTPLDALRVSYPDLVFAQGYSFDETNETDAQRDEAVGVAADADAVIAFIGLPASDESEGFDRTHLLLPTAQLRCLAAIAEVNPNIVTVIFNGSTVDLRQVAPHSRAIIEAWLCGQAVGGAVADVLTGVECPSGHLAETIPYRLEDNSSFLNFPGEGLTVNYGEGVFIGYRGYDQADQDVMYPFGFGLSYTNFLTTDVQAEISGSAAEGTLSAEVTAVVTNTGSRRGAHVLQVYIHDPVASVPRPPRELKGFKKVWLEAGESKTIAVSLDQRAFSYWSEALDRWVVESGTFSIQVGDHSRAIVESIDVAIDAPSIAGPLTKWSTLSEWNADELGRSVIAEFVARGAWNPLTEAKLRVMGNAPLQTVSTFPGVSLTPPEVADAVALWEQRSSATTTTS